MARNTSTAYVQQLKQSRKHCVKVIITYTDGTSDTLTELKDFMKLKLEDACSGTSEFEIGSAIINEAVVTLNNRTGKFKDKSFFGASVTIYTGIYVDGVPELLKMGTYIVDEPVAPGSTINLVAFDNMVKADKQYVPGIVYPATNAQIAADTCSQCGLVLKNLDFPNSDYIVDEVPEGNYTCREILSFVAQMGACFVRCDVNGQVEIRWYKEEVTHEVSELQSKDICTDVVTVTGIDVLSGSETIASSGEEGYKLAIKDNALIQEGDEQILADFLAGKLVGLSFRPLSVTCRSDASIEAGDKVRVIDEKGNSYETLVTSTTFTMMSAQKVECNAASPIINSSNRLSETAKAIIASKKYTQILVEQEKTTREKALEEMSKRITESSGMYMTTKKQQDGSVVYYGHDKIKLEDSLIIWKFGLEAIGISTDGGKTYPYGFNISGTATLNRIYAVGIDADYITSGTFVAKDRNGKIVFSVNVDTGEVVINASSVKMSSGKTLTEEISDMDQKINNIDGTFFFIRYSANADGSNMTEIPQSDTLYMGTCSTNSSTAPTDYRLYTWALIRGKDGKDGTKGTDGSSNYFHVKYSNDGKTFTSNNGETLGDWMGTCVTATETDPTDFNAYTWKKIVGEDGKSGIDGIDGQDGKSCFFFVKFSANEDGNPMTETPTSTTKYMGVCSTNINVAPTSYTDYTWTQCRGNDGKQGIPGVSGIDGKTQYLHIKYSDDGTTFTANDGEDLGAWIGTLVDFTEADSTNFEDYTWKKFTEDVDDELNEMNQTIIKQFTDFTKNNEKILMEAVKSYTTTGDFETYQTEVKSLFEQMAESISMRFIETSKTISNVDGDLQKKYNQIATFFKFGTDGMTIGKDESPFQTKIDNEKYSMTVNGVEAIGLDPDGKSTIPSLTVPLFLNLCGYIVEEDSTSDTINCGWGGGS